MVVVTFNLLAVTFLVAQAVQVVAVPLLLTKAVVELLDKVLLEAVDVLTHSLAVAVVAQALLVELLAVKVALVV
jgi:hypothetical protein